VTVPDDDKFLKHHSDNAKEIFVVLTVIICRLLIFVSRTLFHTTGCLGFEPIIPVFGREKTATAIGTSV
jgi:hypothetical protein